MTGKVDIRGNVHAVGRLDLKLAWANETARKENRLYGAIVPALQLQEAMRIKVGQRFINIVLIPVWHVEHVARALLVEGIRIGELASND